MVIAELQQSQPFPPSVVLEVVRRLELGQVLLLPTDTVYGLHAHSRNAQAVQRVRDIKNLEDDRPFSNLHSSAVDLSRYVVLPEGSLRHKVLSQWPGAVTWVLPARGAAPEPVLGEDKTLGVRVPNHQFLRSVCTALNDLVVSTSANLHGQPPAIRREELDPKIVEQVDGVIYQLEPLPGRPSEVKRWTPAGPEVLRTREHRPGERERVQVLLVCSGNICRSPMAQAILARRLEQEAPGRFLVRSAGTIARSELKATLPAMEVMRDRGYDIGAHRSRSVNEDLLEWADVVLVMTADHLGELYDRYPHHADKISLLTSFPETAADEAQDVEDPYGLNRAAYEEVADRFEEELPRLVPHLIALVEQKR